MAKTWRNDTRYVRQREALKRRYRAANLPCAWCGLPFDWGMENRRLYPDYWKHPKSFTADHVEAVNVGGKMAPGIDGLRGLHRACNASRGDGTRARRAPVLDRPLKTSREW